MICSKKEELTQGNSQVQYEGIINANSPKDSVAQDIGYVNRFFIMLRNCSAEKLASNIKTEYKKRRTKLMETKKEKQEKISIEDAMRKYARLEREGKLPMDTEEFSPSISAEVLRKLRQNAKDSESR